jgi:hypothetical protein
MYKAYEQKDRFINYLPITLAYKMTTPSIIGSRPGLTRPIFLGRAQGLFLHSTTLCKKNSSRFGMVICNSIEVSYTAISTLEPYRSLHIIKIIPRGTCHMPPRPTLNCIPATSTRTLPVKTQNTMWLFLEFFIRFTPPGGRSTIPE